MAQNEMRDKPVPPERVRSMEGLGRTLAHCFNMMAVWINNKSGKVVRAIVLADSRASIVCASGGSGGGVKADNCLASWGTERDMKPGIRAACARADLLDGKFVAFTRRAVANGLPLLTNANVRPNAYVAEWSKCFVIELGRSVYVSGSQRDVVKHVHVGLCRNGALCGLTFYMSGSRRRRGLGPE